MVSDMTITWSEPAPTPYGSGKTKIDVKDALGDIPPDRFFLYQTPDAAKKLPTMWVLYDQTTGTQWMLYGEGWSGAELKAASRIEEILSKEA